MIRVTFYDDSDGTLLQSRVLPEGVIPQKEDEVNIPLGKGSFEGRVVGRWVKIGAPGMEEHEVQIFLEKEAF